MTELATGTKIPAATLDAIYDWFQFRQVCDNERFNVYFNRELRKWERQYLLLLRNDMCEWDPMVAEYMEHAIDESLNRTEGGTEGATIGVTDSGDDTHEYRGTDKVTSKGGESVTETPESKFHDSVTHKYEGKEKDVERYTRNLIDAETRNFADRTEDKQHHFSESTGQQDTVSDAKQLDGSTPDSSMYGTGSSVSLASPGNLTKPAEGHADRGVWPAVLHEVGAPDKLNWTYTSGQSERIDKSDQVNRDSSEQYVTGDISEYHTGGGTKTASGGDTRAKSKEFENRKDTDIRLTYVTGEDKTKTIRNSTDTTLYGKTETVKYGKKQDTTKTESHSGHANDNRKLNERHSGRHEAPPELLKKAQEYILHSNSLDWLLKRLEGVFFQIYESW